MIRRLHRRSWRCRIALLGVFAILLQATLVGWHHHERRLPAPQAGAALLAAQGTAAAPAMAEDECEICQALQHLSAAPGIFAVQAAPPAAAAAVSPAPARVAAHAAARGFQARAPPRA